MPLFKGQAPNYNDINIPGFAFGMGASPPDKIDILPSGSIRALGFDGGVTTEELHSSGEILHGYVEGTDLDIHVHWITTTTNAGNVKWQLEYHWINPETVYGDPTIISSTTATNETAWKSWHSYFPPIDGTGKDQGSELVFRLFRDPTEDTYASDAALIQVGIHYQIDALGSRQPEIK